MTLVSYGSFSIYKYVLAEGRIRYKENPRKDL